MRADSLNAAAAERSFLSRVCTGLVQSCTRLKCADELRWLKRHKFVPMLSCKKNTFYKCLGTGLWKCECACSFVLLRWVKKLKIDHELVVWDVYSEM